MKRERGEIVFNLFNMDQYSGQAAAFIPPVLRRTRCADCLKPLDIMHSFTERDGHIVHVRC